MPYLKPLKGRLLIAEPSILNDNSFNRAIILITEHTKSSSVGFILNRPLEYTLQDQHFDDAIGISNGRRFVTHNN